MVKLADFSGLIELALGLNALFYFLEVIPRVDEKLKILIVEFRERQDDLAALTKQVDRFPIGFYVGCSHLSHKTIFGVLLVVNSVLLLGLLIYTAFNPDSQLPVSWMWLILALAYLPPLVAYLWHRRMINRVQRWIDALEKQIRIEKGNVSGTVKRLVAAENVTP